MSEYPISAVSVSPLTLDLDRCEATLVAATASALVFLLYVPSLNLLQAGLNFAIPLLLLLITGTVLFVSSSLLILPAPLWVIPSLALTLFPREFVLSLLLALLDVETLRLCQNGWGLVVEGDSSCTRADHGDGEASNKVPHCCL